MEINKREEAFADLGKFMAQFTEHSMKNEACESLNALFYEPFEELIKTAYQYNGWFTEQSVRRAVGAISDMLDEEKITQWVKRYNNLNNSVASKRVGVIMAGNIPMVGFHDFMTVLMSGHIFVGKLSSSDNKLLPFLAEVLMTIEPGFREKIYFTPGQLKDIEAVIATGSNNSARYFEYYFGKYPNVIRKNRNAVAVLDGSESNEELEKLGKDIFQYFGLGCRNVSKLFLPKGYDLDTVFRAIYPFNDIINHKKYGNNYDYNKTCYLLNDEKLLENGFLLLKEDIGLASPVAVLFYEYYKDDEELQDKLRVNHANIQCVVGNRQDVNNIVPFGDSQIPELWDYADGVDTMEFLLGLN